MLPDHLIEQDHKPVNVNVQAGQKNQVTIPVIPCCSISGNIILYEFEDIFALMMSDEPATLQEKCGVAGLRIIISRDNEKEIYTDLTDTHGCFYFPRLRPGKWLVSVDTEYLPDLHYINMNHLILEIQPGEDKEMTLEIFPEEKTFHKME